MGGPARDSDEEGVLRERDLEDGRIAQLCTLLFGQGRIAAGQKGSQSYDEEWMYRTMAEAKAAFEAWDGATGTAPGGLWTRHWRDGVPGYDRRQDDGSVAHTES